MSALKSAQNLRRNNDNGAQNLQVTCAEFSIYLHRMLTYLPQRDGQSNSIWVVDKILRWCKQQGAWMVTHSSTNQCRRRATMLFKSRPVHYRWGKPLPLTITATYSVAQRSPWRNPRCWIVSCASCCLEFSVQLLLRRPHQAAALQQAGKSQNQ